MPRLTIKKLMLWIAILGVMMGVTSLALRRGRIIEELNNPRQVIRWDSSGLILDDGRTVSLPGITNLPPDSNALTVGTTRGVEITPDGRVIGLVRIHHWCGNDPIRNHIARVDLAEMMMLLKEGSFKLDPEIANLDWPATGRFSQSGWNISEFNGLKVLHSLLESKSSTERVIGRK